MGEYEWVGTREAAARLGVSPSTVERLVRRGELVAERVERPGGTRLLIRFDRPQEPPQAASDDVVTPEPPPASESPQATSDATTRLLDALEGRDAAFDALHQSYACLYGELADARERVGRAEADAAHAERERRRADDLADTLIALRASLSATQAERDRLAAELARRRWWRWWS